MNPIVTVIIPTHLDCNKPYLDLCLRALSQSKGIAFHTIVAASTKTKPEVPSNMDLIWDVEKISVSSKLNVIFDYTLGWIKPETKYVLLLSDDVVVSEYMLKDMVYAFNGRDFIMNPMSNSDSTALYEADMHLERVNFDGMTDELQIYPNMQIEDLEGWERSIIQYRRAPKCLMPVNTLSFYCTMMPKSVWDKVGPLDPNLEYRFNDTDFCLRALRMGVQCMVNFGTFAFHFGSRTICQIANEESKLICQEHFLKKWNLK